MSYEKLSCTESCFPEDFLPVLDPIAAAIARCCSARAKISRLCELFLGKSCASEVSGSFFVLLYLGLK